MRDFQAEAEEALLKGGAVYNFNDILEAIGTGAMQSFALNNSLVVTKINAFPRRKVLEVVLAVGDYEDIAKLEAQVIVFAANNGCSGMFAAGRDGWYGRRTAGWNRTGSVYFKELGNA